MLQLLNPLEKKKLQKIWDADYQTIIKGKDNSVPFLSYVFQLHLKIFGETCSTCPNKINGYIKKLKNLNKVEIMSEEIKKSNFTLHTGTIIPVPGTSISYSNANLTDEIAIELLAININRKVLFVKLPENLDELIEEYKQNLESAGDDDSNLVTVGEVKITLEQALDALKKMNISTRATTVEGVEKKIKSLSEADTNELIGLATFKAPEVLENILPKTKDELEFDLEKAEQDLLDLQDNDPDNTEAIAEVEKAIESIKLELAKLS